MSDFEKQIPSDVLEALKENKDRLWWAGLVLAIIGFILMVFPVFGSITTKVFIGWFFLIGGGMGLWHAFQSRTWKSALWTGLVAIVNLAVGVYLAFFPLTGLIGLTVLLAFAFGFQGAIEVYVAFQNKESKGWGWMLLSGIASLILSVLLIMDLPGSALWALGLMTGINLLTTGIAFIMLSKSV